MKPSSIRDRIRDAVAETAPAVSVPEVSSLREFLLNHCRVKVGSHYQPYDMAGRPALELATQWVDDILAGGRADCRIKIKGGAARRWAITSTPICRGALPRRGYYQISAGRRHRRCKIRRML